MATLNLHLPESEVRKLIEKFRPSSEKMEILGMFLKGQVQDRFQTAGASGGAAWASPKKVAQWGHDDGRSLLTGRTGSLKERFFSAGEVRQAAVWSDVPYARIQQLGTTGKGGVLADIVPVRAKMLFIPLTDRAASSERMTGSPAARMRESFGMRSLEGPLRAATSGPRIKGTSIFQPLVQGRFVNGKIEPKNADFVLVKKVSIPPRPMLPDSQQERTEQVKEFVYITLHGAN